MTRLWLVGMPGSGKSTVGRAVADRLKVDFTDTDELVETLAGQSIPELWANHGETRFRDLESIVMAGLGDVQGVIATGGGAVLDPESRTMLDGTVVWLEATVETLESRLADESERPVLEGPPGGVARMLLMRTPVYARSALHRISTDGRSIDDIAREVVALWKP